MPKTDPIEAAFAKIGLGHDFDQMKRDLDAINATGDYDLGAAILRLEAIKANMRITLLRAAATSGQQAFLTGYEKLRNQLETEKAIYIEMLMDRLPPDLWPQLVRSVPKEIPENPASP